mgnify:CR=1 FL=1
MGQWRSLLLLEETQFLFAVADQDALELLVVVEDDLVCFATDAGFFVATKRGVSRVSVIAVRPDAASFDRTAHAVSDITVTAPDASAETINGVVGDC